MSDSRTDASDRAEQRAQRYAGRITDDERLAGDLPSVSSDALISWAVDSVAALAATTAGLGDAVADPILEAGVGAIKQLLGSISAVLAAHEASDVPLAQKGLGQVAREAADPALRSIFVDGRRRTTAALAADLDQKPRVAYLNVAELGARIIAALTPLAAASRSPR